MQSLEGEPRFCDRWTAIELATERRGPSEFFGGQIVGLRILLKFLGVLGVGIFD